LDAAELIKSATSPGARARGILTLSRAVRIAGQHTRLEFSTPEESAQAAEAAVE
jgi:hypothetical protein